MNRYRRLVGAGVIISLVGVALAACKQASNNVPLAPNNAWPILQFEPEPHSLSVLANISPTRHPKIGLDSVASGVVHVLVVIGDGDESRLAMINSNNGGDTYEKPVWVSEAGIPVSSHGENSPTLIMNPDITYAAWNQKGDIRLARSLSWGESFEKPVRISDKPTQDFSGYVALGVAPDGDVYAVWLDTRDREHGDKVYSLYTARSTDHGQTFAKNIRVAAHVCECCRPIVTFGSNGEVLVFWRHIYPGSVRDMTVAVSHDSGETFSAPVRIAADNWRLEGCPDSGVALARSGNRIYAAWLTEASRAISGGRLSWSDNAGESWAPAVSASQNVLDAKYPAMSAASDGRVELVFQGRNPLKDRGWATTSAFLVEIANDGSRSAPVEVPGVTAAVSRPTVYAATNGRLFVGWTAAQDGTAAAFISRARQM